jgi:hypothetical protein
VELQERYESALLERAEMASSGVRLRAELMLVRARLGEL